MISYSYSLEVTYSNPEHPHTRPNEPKCKIYGKSKIGSRLCESVDQKRICAIVERRRVGRELLARVPRPKLY